MKIIKTSEALPKSGRYVLAWLEGAKIPMRAMWAAQHTLPLGDDADPEWGEYSEEKDEYFCPAGWYEMNQHEEQHWGVDGNVVAWCELPRLDHQCLAQIEEPAQPVAEICSASHDDAQFGERAIKPLRDISGFEYGTPLYAGAAPAAVAPQGMYPPLPIAVGSPAWKAVREQERERLRLLAEQPAAVAGPANIEALRHSANEWADMAANGLQWIRNIADGISDPKEALENMESNLAHCRAVNDAPEVQAIVRATPSAAPALEAPAAPAGWKLVPEKPTDAMLGAAQKAWLADPLRRSSTLYAAALAAAPQAPAAPSGTDEVTCVCGATWERHGHCDYEMVHTPREAAPAAPSPHSAKELVRLADIMRDCGRLVSTSGNVERILRAAANDLAAAISAAKPTPANVAAPAAPAVDAPVKILSQAARDVLAERRRQVEAEGWTSEHDDQHDEGEMCFAAAGYAAVASDNLQAISRDIDRDLTLDDNVYPPTNYPWPRSWEFKPCTPRRALVKAGALILAEIERIDRCSPDAAQAAAKGASES